MNSKQLRQSLRLKWLDYYRENREWIDHLGIWITSEGQRRPSSGFILGVLSSLEPNLTQLLPLVVDLSSNPDRIITALGLNISPAQELKNLEESQRMLPGSQQSAAISTSIASMTKPEVPAVRHPDEECRGANQQTDDRPRAR